MEMRTRGEKKRMKRDDVGGLSRVRVVCKRSSGGSRG